MGENILIVHGGGPTSVINASLYGAVKEAKKYKKEVDEYEEEQQYRAEHIDELVEAFINEQTKAQLREILMDVLYDSSDWTFDDFVRKYIE